MSARGRHEEAIAEARKAQELDPLSLGINLGLGTAHYLARRFDKTIELYRKALKFDQHASGYALMGAALLQQGRIGNAIAQLEKAVELDPGNAGYAAELGNAYAVVSVPE